MTEMEFQQLSELRSIHGSIGVPESIRGSIQKARLPRAEARGSDQPIDPGSLNRSGDRFRKVQSIGTQLQSIQVADFGWESLISAL